MARPENDALHIELDTKECECSAGEIERMERNLDPLAKVVRDFPQAKLYITIIYHPRSKDYHVKTALVLPKKTLFTGDRDVAKHPPYERCVRKLVKKVQAYKARLGNEAEYAKSVEGTHHQVLPSRAPDSEALQNAVENGDYATFRSEMDVYDETLRSRIGRWIQRYPDIESQIGDRLSIADIMEEVYLNAFDGFENRPQTVPLHEWLEGLIDPSVKALERHPEQEIENINFARTAMESTPPPEPPGEQG